MNVICFPIIEKAVVSGSSNSGESYTAVVRLIVPNEDQNTRKDDYDQSSHHKKSSSSSFSVHLLRSIIEMLIATCGPLIRSTVKQVRKAQELMDTEVISKEEVLLDIPSKLHSFIYKTLRHFP